MVRVALMQPSAAPRSLSLLIAAAAVLAACDFLRSECVRREYRWVPHTSCPGYTLKDGCRLGWKTEMIHAKVCVERRCLDGYKFGSGEADTVWRDKYFVSGPSACLTEREAAKKAKGD